MKRPSPVAPAEVFRSWRMLLAFGFGSGLARVVPGTLGTMAAIPPYLVMAFLLPDWAYGLAVVVSFGVGIHLCGYAADTLKVHDHPGIVWDEFVGFWLTMFMVPLAWEWVLIGFLLFRFFDMVKPWPISWLDKKVHGGFGIMIDDILAGLAAWGCLQLLIALV